MWSRKLKVFQKTRIVKEMKRSVFFFFDIIITIIAQIGHHQHGCILADSSKCLTYPFETPLVSTMTPVDSNKNFITSLSVVVANVCETLRICEKVCRLKAGSGIFKPLL